MSGTHLQIKYHYFQLQNRRYLGNKYKLLDFIENVIYKNVRILNLFVIFLPELELSGQGLIIEK